MTSRQDYDVKYLGLNVTLQKLKKKLWTFNKIGRDVGHSLGVKIRDFPLPKKFLPSWFVIIL